MATSIPFPGMDPWLEQFWGDVHTRLVSYACDTIQEKLAPGLVARMQERVYVESPLLEPRQWVPDVHVYEDRPSRSKPSAESAAIAAEPVLLHVADVQITEPYIEIRDAKSSGGRVITVIEFVSRSNKSSKAGRKQYLQKQREVIRSETNLVEIDLLRGGKSVTLAAPDALPPDKRAPYHACVRRGINPQTLEYYPLPLRQRLPVIRVPLRASDDDVLLDLQALIEQAHARGHYGETIDYTRSPRPPLSDEDMAWAREQLEQRV